MFLFIPLILDLKYLVMITIEKMKKTKKNPSSAIKMISAMRNSSVPLVPCSDVLGALSAGLENIQCEQVSLVHSASISRGLPLGS